MKYMENVLSYENYYKLRESAGWTNFSKMQAQNSLNNSLYSVIAEKGKESFYEALGFKRIPHEFYVSGMRKVIYKE